MISRSAEETRAAGREFASVVRAGDMLLLEGALGTGKTTFVQGLAEGLGAALPVTSPSFVIVQEYPLAPPHASSRGRLLRHIDLYRLPDPRADLDRIALPELLNDSTAVTAIEWADRLPPRMREEISRTSENPRTVRVVRFAHGDAEGARRITWDEPSRRGT